MKELENEMINKDIQICKLKRKNLYKNIIIIIMGILLVCSSGFAISMAQNTNEMKKAKQPTGEKPVLEEYNSRYKLNLVSAYGDIEAYHPKILYMDNKWNNYYYWMSFTPYPSSDATKETPHIVASNDMINWEEPKGYKNPLDQTDRNNKNQYNSDSHIVMNEDLNRLECYWRYVDDDTNKAMIYRKYTTNGVDWSEKECVAITNDRKNKDYISPAIIYEDGIYKIWYVDKENTLRYAEAKDGEKWEDKKIIELQYDKNLRTWHLDVVKTNEGYEMLVMAYENIKQRGRASLYYAQSKDNENWTECIEIIKPTTDTKNWDNRGIYRSSMIKKDGIYYVFYSASNEKNIKGTGIMYGKDIFHLKKVNIDFIKDKKAVEKFEKMIQEEKDAKG